MKYLIAVLGILMSSAFLQSCNNQQPGCSVNQNKTSSMESRQSSMDNSQQVDENEEVYED